MTSTQTIGQVKPWRVGVEVIAEDLRQPLEYVDGIPRRPTIVSRTYIGARGRTIAEVRERLRRLIPTWYDEHILQIGFFNTRPYKKEDEKLLAPFPGLTQRIT